MTNKDLNGKTVVITGASSGIGKAMALAFAEEGVNLVLAARRETLLQELASECESLGCEAIAVKTDVTDWESVRELRERAFSFYDKIDIWINNAGVGALGEFDETPLDAHEQVIKTNLFGAMYGSYYVLSHFKERREGQIINMNSTGAYVATPFAEAYNISQFGLRGLAESLRYELKGYSDIHVSDVFTSLVDTTAIHHLANYIGKEIKLPRAQLDPFHVARAVVKLAKKPKDSLHLGSSDLLVRVGHALSPRLTGYLMNKFANKYLRKADLVEMTDGNLFGPLYKGTEVRSGLH